jgi:hypothetical protein
MSGDRGRPEVSAVRSNRRDQPLADVGRLLASGTPRDQLRRDPTAGPSSIGGNRQVTPSGFRGGKMGTMLHEDSNGAQLANGLAKDVCMLGSILSASSASFSIYLQ